MKDSIQYAIDYLPKFVDIEFEGGVKAVYGLKIQFNGIKGFALGYWLDTDYCDDFTRNEEVWRSVYEQLETRFSGKPSPNCLFGAEYIRDEESWRRVLKSCYDFLRKHGLTKKRQHNIRSKKKLFLSEIY